MLRRIVDAPVPCRNETVRKAYVDQRRPLDEAESLVDKEDQCGIGSLYYRSHICVLDKLELLRSFRRARCSATAVRS